MFTFALNYALGGSTMGFKATNLAIHLVNTLLLVILQSVVASGWHASHDDDDRPLGASHSWALILVTAWALHPLQVSTVLYVVQRMELLGLTFTLLRY